MPHELDKILISYQQPDFQNKLQEFLNSKFGLSHFGMGASHIDNRRIVEKILNEFVENENRVAEVLAKYTEMFDKVNLTPDQFRISKEDLEKAHKELKKNNPKLLSSIQQSIKNVRKYQKEIYIGDFKHPGIKYTPIKRVGICVPGASAPLPSTVIMCAVPAQVAGVKEIVVVSPPRYENSIHPVTLAVCHELGIDEVYRIGGAQAIAALTFSTETIKEVDKIVGPGNQWVQTAKQLVFGTVGIDSIAGPSEVVIIANDKANPAWVAADMLSQAEHNPGCAFLFSTSQKVAGNVLEEIKKQVEQLNRSKETIECLKAHSGIAVFANMEDLIEKANDFTAEHLQIQCGEHSREIADRIENAGAIFIGDYSPVAVGDYWAGPSHTLPTGISAKFFSPLSANDFIKSTSIIEYDKKKLAESADDIIRLAEVEGLDAHAKSVRIRQQD
ncbi:MAG: histidinol dehydrogenase [Sedimentisphaerales bacterium]|nr:histidinol dehydrogenase [Sedimentisphaerales bacterium]